jgi:uncharacterized membrane protein YbhN (UPF0104 family)
VRRALALAVPVAVLAVLWHVADGPGALRLLASAEPWWLVAAFAALNAQTVLSALRWRRAARGLGMEMAAGLAIREYYVAQLGNQTLPGGVAGDAARAFRARGAAGFGPAALAVAVERLAGQAALMAALSAGAALSLLVPGVAWPSAVWPALVSGLALAALGAIAGLSSGRHALGRAVRAGLLAPSLWPGQAALSAAVLVLNLAAFALAARATGTVLPLVAVLALVPLILTAMLVPATVAGWGWREGAAAALFPMAGAGAEAGLAASLAFGLLMLVSAVPGALWLIRGREVTER